MLTTMRKELVWMAGGLVFGASAMVILMRSCGAPPPPGEPIKVKQTELFAAAERIEADLPVAVPVLPQRDVDRLRVEYDRPDLVSAEEVIEGASEDTPAVDLIEAWAEREERGALPVAEHEIPPLLWGGKGLSALEEDGFLSLTIVPHPEPPPPFLDPDAVGRIGVSTVWRTALDRNVEEILEGFDSSALEPKVWADFSPAKFKGKWRPYGGVSWSPDLGAAVELGVYRELD